MNKMVRLCVVLFVLSQNIIYSIDTKKCIGFLGVFIIAGTVTYQATNHQTGNLRGSNNDDDWYNNALAEQFSNLHQSNKTFKSEIGNKLNLENKENV